VGRGSVSCRALYTDRKAYWVNTHMTPPSAKPVSLSILIGTGLPVIGSRPRLMSRAHTRVANSRKRVCSATRWPGQTLRMTSSKFFSENCRIYRRPKPKTWPGKLGLSRYRWGLNSSGLSKMVGSMCIDLVRHGQLYDDHLDQKRTRC
jgi:hypothetical protein